MCASPQSCIREALIQQLQTATHSRPTIVQGRTTLECRVFETSPTFRVCDTKAYIDCDLSEQAKVLVFSNGPLMRYMPILIQRYEFVRKGKCQYVLLIEDASLTKGGAIVETSDLQPYYKNRLVCNYIRLHEHFVDKQSLAHRVDQLPPVSELVQMSATTQHAVHESERKDLPPSDALGDIPAAELQLLMSTAQFEPLEEAILPSSMPREMHLPETNCHDPAFAEMPSDTRQSLAFLIAECKAPNQPHHKIASVQEQAWPQPRENVIPPHASPVESTLKNPAGDIRGPASRGFEWEMIKGKVKAKEAKAPLEQSQAAIEEAEEQDLLGLFNDPEINVFLSQEKPISPPSSGAGHKSALQVPLLLFEKYVRWRKLHKEWEQSRRPLLSQSLRTLNLSGVQFNLAKKEVVLTSPTSYTKGT